MTDKIFKENPGYGREELVDALENLFFAELVIIPWDRYEMFGHADGMVRYIDGDRVLMNNYGNIDPYFRKRLLKALTQHFEVEELHYTAPRPSKQSWAFLNYLQVKDCIFVPNLPIPESRQAQEQLMRIFPNKKVIMIDGCKDLVLEGGALHCVSWNVMGETESLTLEDS
jgi:agmatine/peptidylarginine deiminase